MISIVVPVYNAEQKLPTTLKSILEQTFKDFELILVDDGSFDNSLELCNEYSKNDNRIIVVHTTNQGASMARNVGIDHSTEELITFIDSDDVVSPDYLQSLYQAYENAGHPDLVMQGLIQEWPDNTRIEFKLAENVFDLNGKDRIQFFEKVYLNDYSGPYCKLFKRSIIREHNLSFSSNIIYGEDFDFLLRYLQFTSEIATSSSLYYHYIMDEGTVSRKIYSVEKELSGLTRIYTSFVSLISNNNYYIMRLRDMMHDCIIPYLWRVIYSNYRNGYSRKYRIENLRKIPQNILNEFCYAYKPPTIFTKTVNYLLKNRRFGALDGLLSFRL